MHQNNSNSKKACPELPVPSRIEGKRGGFTLIELLMVIGITAILACILFPFFARARETARKDSCQSSLKQLALAAQMYASDNDGELPPPTGKTDFFAVMHDYTKNDQLVCPSYTWVSGPGKSGYGANYNLTSIERIIGVAAEVPLLTETRYGKPWFQSPEAVSRRHKEGANFAFADGHVKWLKKNNSESDDDETVLGFESLDYTPALKPIADTPIELTSEKRFRRGDTIILPDGSKAVVFETAP